MNSLSTAIGLVTAAALLVLLALTRLLMPEVDGVDLEVREIELAALPEPPPPPPPEPPPDQPPPPPALTELSEVPDPTLAPIPKAEVPLRLDTPVDPFFTELAPAPLPQPAVSRAVAAASPSRPRRPSPAAPPRPAAKSHYSLGELDGKPRLLRHGSAAFPSSLARRGVRQGTVTFEVELSPNGRVSVRRVVSSTHAELIDPARRIARSARFTAPTRRGEPVRAIMRWPITIRK